MLQHLRDPGSRALSPPSCQSRYGQTYHPGAHLDLLDAAALLRVLRAPDGDALLVVVAEPALRPQTLVSEGQEVRVIRDLHLHAGARAVFLVLPPRGAALTCWADCRLRHRPKRSEWSGGQSSHSDWNSVDENFWSCFTGKYLKLMENDEEADIWKLLNKSLLLGFYFISSALIQWFYQVQHLFNICLVNTNDHWLDGWWCLSGEVCKFWW